MISVKQKKRNLTYAVTSEASGGRQAPRPW